jgi:hypothetical protein
MKVKVRWLRSPLKKYGLPFGYPGKCNFIEKELADRIAKESPDMIVIIEKEKPIKVKDTMAYEPRTRPVKREKKD